MILQASCKAHPVHTLPWKRSSIISHRANYPLKNRLCSQVRSPFHLSSPTSTHTYTPRCAQSSSQVPPAPAGVFVDTSPSTSSQQGLIFSLGQPGSWDDTGVGHPVVRYYLGDNEQRWFMWYTGRSTTCPNLDDVYPSSGSIGVAISDDGVTWSRGRGAIEGARGEGRAADVGKVLSPNKDWWWHDTLHMHVSDVQILSNNAVGGGTGVYWCFYSGGSFETTAEVPSSMMSVDDGDEASGTVSTSSTTTTATTTTNREGVTLRPGLAMSQDGRNWARIEADHHTGALFDVGAPGEWDSLFIGAPQVINSGPGDMRMYYHSYDASRDKFIIGLATSPDGFNWTKQGPVFEGGRPESEDFDARGVASRCVVVDPDTRKYFMFYEAVAWNGGRSIGLAVSDDGKGTWRRHPHPVFTPACSSSDGCDDAGEAWDQGAVGTPCAVPMAKGKWRLYYSGRKGVSAGPWEGIGLALSEDGVVNNGTDNAPVKFKRRTTGGI